MSTLDEHLDGVLPLPEQREGWSINDDAAAEWALRKLTHLKAAMDADRKLAEAEVERVNAWLAEKQRAYENEASFFENQLKSYHWRRFVADPKAKTIKLPHGRLICRKQQPEYTIDADVLLAYVKENHPQLVKVKESTNWSVFKGFIELAEPEGITAKCVDITTGEVVEGVVAIIRPERFEVEIRED